MKFGNAPMTFSNEEKASNDEDSDSGQTSKVAKTKSNHVALEKVMDNCVTTGIEVNSRKSSISSNLLGNAENLELRGMFRYHFKPLEEGLKYLGFHLKANDYRIADWKWLLEKLEAHLSLWSHKWLSRAGRLVLVKSVLEAIPVYWMSLSWIPKEILEKTRKICFKFLWSGKSDFFVHPWVRWERIVVPKALGGWGLKNIFLFSKALAAKCGWRLLKSDSLWKQVVTQKYIRPRSLEEWIRLPTRSHQGASVIWKVVVSSFHVIRDGLAWSVGNGQRVKTGEDPWVGCDQQHLLSA